MTKLVLNLFLVCVVVGLASLADGAPAKAQGTAQPTVGVVDVQKAFTEYNITKTSNAEITKQAAAFKLDLDTRSINKLMTEAEINELIKLKVKTPATDADKKRIDELEKLSKQRDEELNTLSNKTDPSEQERGRLRELRDLGNKNEASARTAADDYNQQLEKRQKELSDKITSDIQAAIAKVAQQKGLATVVDKIAVLYGGIDVTEDVIKVLNGK